MLLYSHGYCQNRLSAAVTHNHSRALLAIADAGATSTHQSAKTSPYELLTSHSLQDIADAGLYHPTINSSLAARVAVGYTPADYPIDGMRSAGFVCGCGDYFDNPCRAEFRKVLALIPNPLCYMSLNLGELVIFAATSLLCISQVATFWSMKPACAMELRVMMISHAVFFQSRG